VEKYLLAMLLACGCAHHAPPPTAMEATADTIGQTHAPYLGKPSYLASARDPMYRTRSIRERDAAAERACQARSPSCDDRLRAVLASIDGQTLALHAQPSTVEVEALRLSLIQLTPLLTPYPDMGAERDELAALVEKLPTMSPKEVAATQKRMAELTDLIRLQLAAR
jgi:hypothetical protein